MGKGNLNCDTRSKLDGSVRADFLSIIRLIKIMDENNL